MKGISSNMIVNNRIGKRLIVGVNYWPASSGPFMWEEWNDKEYEKDFSNMKSKGLNSARVFLFLRDFMPSPDSVDESSLRKLDRLIEIANRNSIALFPSIFVGHMSGENWDFPWRNGEDFYRDEKMLRAEELLVRTLARRYKSERQIAGWILSNELPLYAGDTDPNTARSWTERMIKAMREEGDSHPISTGDGLFSRGFRIEWLVDLLDWAGPHVYTYFGLVMDSIKWSFLHEAKAVYSSLGKLVLMEEFGCSKTLVSEENEAAYYRNVIYSSLIAGCKGFLAWCYSDFKCKGRRPYLHHPFELQFGVFRADGSPRPSAIELRRISEIDSKVNLSRYSPREGQTAILVPSHQYIDYPFIEWRINRNEYNMILLESFTMARLAGLTVEMIREVNRCGEITEKETIEGAPNLSKKRLVIVPSCKMLLSLTWDMLIDYVKGGGTLYTSFSSDNWIPVMRELFGCEHKLVYGEGQLPKNNKVTMKFLRNFGPFKRGERFTVPVAGKIASTFTCPIEPKEAEPIAVDSDGEPTLIINHLGSGNSIFLNFPFEYYLANMSQSYSSYGYEKLYSALASIAKVQEPFKSSNRLVEVGVLDVKDKSESLLILLNHSWGKQSAKIKPLTKVKSFKNVETQEVINRSVLSVTLEPKGSRIFQVLM